MFKTQVEIPNAVTLANENDLPNLNASLALLNAGFKYYGGTFVPEGYVVRLAKITPYGITWANEKSTVCQTGYVFETIEKAREMALAGPNAAHERGIQVDSLVPDEYLHVVRYAHIETEGGELLCPEIKLPKEDSF